MQFPTKQSDAEKNATAHYLLVMEGDVEPTLHGPFADETEVLAEARKQRKEDPAMENGLFRLSVLHNVPTIEAFAGIDLEYDEEES